MKLCTKCHRLLPETEFYVRRDHNTLQSQCKDCCKAHGRLRNGTTGIYKKENTNMEKKINVIARVETITPSLAAEYLAHNKVNRPLNKRTVDFYAAQMCKGQWKVNGEAICFTKEGNMVNGQHRLNAIIKYGHPVDILVVRNCDEDVLPTYDSGRKRKSSDVFYLNGVKNYTNISAAVNKYMRMHVDLSFAVTTSLTTYKQISNADLITEYRTSPALYDEAVSFATKCYDKLRILTISEGAGLYVYLIKDIGHDTETVKTFFRMLFFNEDVTNKTVSLLREKLINDRISRKRMTAKYKSMLTVKAWNAYIQGRELSLLKWNENAEGRLNFI